MNNLKTNFQNVFEIGIQKYFLHILQFIVLIENRLLSFNGVVRTK